MEVDSLALEAAKEVEVEAVMEEDPGEEVEAVVEEEVGAALAEEVALVEEVALEEEVGAAVEKEVEGHPSPSPIPQNLVAVTHKATRHDTRAPADFPGPTPAGHPPDGQTLDKACSLHCNTGNSWQQAPRPIWDGARWACVPLAVHWLPPLGGLGRPLSLCLVWG